MLPLPKWQLADYADYLEQVLQRFDVFVSSAELSVWWTSWRPVLSEFVENLQAAATVSITTLILDLMGGNSSSPGSGFFESLLMARRSTFAAQKSQD